MRFLFKNITHCSLLQWVTEHQSTYSNLRVENNSQGKDINQCSTQSYHLFSNLSIKKEACQTLPVQKAHGETPKAQDGQTSKLHLSQVNHQLYEWLVIVNDKYGKKVLPRRQMNKPLTIRPKRVVVQPSHTHCITKYFQCQLQNKRRSRRARGRKSVAQQVTLPSIISIASNNWIVNSHKKRGQAIVLDQSCQENLEHWRLLTL